jgi:hypothetical protein
MSDNKTVVGRKINSVEELVKLCERGVLVFCPAFPYLEKPRKIDNVLDLSCRNLLKMIDKGLFAYGEEESAPEDSVLFDGREKIRSLGLSQREIANLVGVSQQAVEKFMNAESVQTSTLSKYLDKLGCT